MKSNLRQLTTSVALIVCCASAAVAAPRVIEMRDKEGEPYKEAVRVLLRAMAKGDLAACKAAFVGEGDDLKVLELMVASNVAASRVRDALIAKFGDPGEHLKLRFTFADLELRIIDVQTIIVDSDRPDEASISPGTYGYELKRRGGKWLVRSMTGFPQDIPRLLVMLPKLTEAYDRLKKRLDDGEIKKEEDAGRALDEIEEIKESVSKARRRRN